MALIGKSNWKTREHRDATQAGHVPRAQGIAQVSLTRPRAQQDITENLEGSIVLWWRKLLLAGSEDYSFNITTRMSIDATS